MDQQQYQYQHHQQQQKFRSLQPLRGEERERSAIYQSAADDYLLKLNERRAYGYGINNNNNNGSATTASGLRDYFNYNNKKNHKQLPNSNRLLTATAAAAAANIQPQQQQQRPVDGIYRSARLRTNPKRLTAKHGMQMNGGLQKIAKKSKRTPDIATIRNSHIHRLRQIENPEPENEPEHYEEDLTSEERVEKRKLKKWRQIRLIKTLVLILAWFCLGLFSEICAPSIPYLMARVDANYEEFSRALLARGIGFLIGALIGGLFCEAFSRYTDLILAIALGLAGIGTALTPLCTNLPMLGAMFSLDGCGAGILAAGGNGFVIRLWKERATAPTYSLHFANGCGALLVQQLVRPFLKNTVVDSKSNNHIKIILPNSTVPDTNDNNNNDNNNKHNTFTKNEAWNASVEYPYAIVACLTFVVALIFLTFFRKSRKDQDWRPDEFDSERRKFIFNKNWYKPTNWTNGDWPLACIVLVFMFVFCPLPIGAERIIGKFLMVYSKEVAQFDFQAEAANLETSFWACFTAGRGISLLLSTCVHPSSVLMWTLASSIICSAILVAYGSKLKVGT